MNRRSYFTLMELLVVMAIITILASLLLPTLGKAKERARQIQCTGNLKQYGTGLGMYVNDNGEYFPRWQVIDANNNWVWELKKAGYITPAICKCPAAVILTSSLVNGKDDCINNPATPFAYYNTAYGYNYMYLGSSYYDNWDIYSPPAKLSKIKKPSDMLAVADQWNNSNGAYCVISPSSAPTNKLVIHDRHQKGANILYVDGHVAWTYNAYWAYNAGDSTIFKRE